METAKKTPPGSVLGGTLLIAGCCIGAGMLGLPVLSALAGFQPSVVILLLSWFFMLTTGLLFLEVTLWFKDEVNIVTMADRTLGFIGKATAWIVFLYLFYCLMVAYIAGSGSLFADFAQEIAGIALPSWVGSIICTILLGIFLYFGTKTADLLNRFLMLGLIGSYVALVILGAPHVSLEFLKHDDWSKALFVLPVMIVSFGFHNLVPSLATYLNHDVPRLRRTIILGSVIPLLVYLAWQALILGLIPVEGEGGFREALDKGQMATQALKNAVGIPSVVDLAQYFAFFAIVTSFVGVALSFIDFLADGLHIKKNAFGKLLLCLLVLSPPLVFAIVYPNIFLEALNYAGGIGAVILFGVLPAAMVWSGRYYKGLGQTVLVPGGKTVLVIVMTFSLVVVVLQLIWGA